MDERRYFDEKRKKDRELVLQGLQAKMQHIALQQRIVAKDAFNSAQYPFGMPL